MVEFAFLVMLSIWHFHDKSVVMVTLKYFAWSVDLSAVWWILYGYMMGFFLEVIRMTSHLSALNSSCHSFFSILEAVKIFL